MRVKIFSNLSVTVYKVIPMVLVMSLLTSSPILAGDENDGNSLLERCKSVEKIGKQGVVLGRGETNNLMYCLGYFSGFTGMYYNTVSLDNFKSTPYCLPKGANWKPLARIVVDFLEKHPELLHQPQEAITTMALSEFFPCKSN